MTCGRNNAAPTSSEQSPSSYHAYVVLLPVFKRNCRAWKCSGRAAARFEAPQSTTPRLIAGDCIPARPLSRKWSRHPDGEGRVVTGTYSSKIGYFGSDHSTNHGNRTRAIRGLEGPFFDECAMRDAGMLYLGVFGVRMRRDVKTGLG